MRQTELVEIRHGENGNEFETCKWTGGAYSMSMPLTETTNVSNMWFSVRHLIIEKIGPAGEL